MPKHILAAFFALTLTTSAADLRIGMIGLDTSHVSAFTKILNDASQKDHVAGARVVAAFKGGSPDIESSASRIEGYTKELTEKYGVTLYPTIEEMCQHVDAVMLESVDGRPHLWQAIPVIQAGKPIYIDKPMAGSLGDVIAIFKLAKEHNVPVFSASSLRYGKNTQAVHSGAIGKVLSAQTSSPYHVEPSHPDMFWYAVHGVESLFTVMGTGCESVKRSTNSAGELVVTGTWSGGRTGTYVESKGYSGHAKGEKGEMDVGAYDGYAPLVVAAVKFFQTREVPFAAAETIEIFAFMEAADESKRRDGAEVPLTDIYERVGYVPGSLDKQ
ncbi:gfo/Idh/MocA family oxidoreductase [bacterium]|nr:gfo/Idh/MocA family oxidoreductase [bacterium]